MFVVCFVVGVGLVNRLFNWLNITCIFGSKVGLFITRLWLVMGRIICFMFCVRGLG